MSTKTIKINPALFQVSTKKKSLKKNASLNEQQQTPSSSSQQPSPKLVKRIPKPKINTTKMKFQKNTFTKAEVNVVSNNNVPAIPPTTNANLHLIADVPFGVLKGGSKPTYRQYYNKTLKKNSSSSSSSPLPSSSLPSPSPSSAAVSSPKHIISKKNKRHTLGKQRGIVGVLLKNKQTQKNVLDAQKKDKKTNLQEVKKYLYKHNLLKIGSTVPNNVCRQMFEASKLTGDITNINTDAILHNLEHKQSEKMIDDVV
jgi:hypothetical protein